MWKYIFRHRKYPLVITVYAETDEAATIEASNTIEGARTSNIVGGATIDLPAIHEWTIHSKAVL